MTEKQTEKVALVEKDRERIIEALSYEMTFSSFAEGCEDKIMQGLRASSDDHLLKLCQKWCVRGIE